MVQLCDTLDATTTARICADGSLVAEVRGARVGIQNYLPAEAGAPDGFSGSVVRVYRPAEEVFSRDSMASFAAAPFTINHPSEMVDASNWRQLGVGEINGDIARDGEFVRVPVIVRDAAAVEKVRTTHKQLSMGYTCTLDWTPGTTPAGEAYDAVQREIRINHIAAVPAARGGPELKISDERSLPPEKSTMKIKIGDAEVDATNGEAVRIAVDGLNSKLVDATTRATTAETSLATATTTLAAKDAEIVTLNQKLADAAMTPAKLRDAAKAYAGVCGKAKALGVTFAEDADSDAIMKAVVDAKMGDIAKGWSAEQIAASFAVLAKDAKVETQTFDASAFKGGIQNLGDAAALADQALAKANNDLNAWRNA
ncbi:hypothetical protein EDF56_101148 [Novosphingobium sp. PhB165]|uniref:DUF2213 domain-containing protein n=1 Tax=Novosphingobium sp. PhB165 TaxID=2485105 RepID=UPI00104989A2|nr:DUF2213 domain-containing protein [Novosphingobium sp. PhB165]TCM21484.1 hypothetical protein EDF56_101148 [Novosphingobium sp. PhB165]